MRRLLIVLGVVAFCSVPTWATSVDYDVNAWATYTATQPCSSNCTETIAVNFLYNPTVAELVPNSLTVDSSGFLGTFSPACTGCSGNALYLGLFNNGTTEFETDEIDLDYNPYPIQPGINTLTFVLWACQTSACTEAYGQSWIGASSIAGVGDATSQSSVVTPVAVPDGAPFLPLCMSSFGAFGLAWRWRREERTRRQ
jgi:hypothetical protein